MTKRWGRMADLRRQTLGVGRHELMCGRSLAPLVKARGFGMTSKAGVGKRYSRFLAALGMTKSSRFLPTVGMTKGGVGIQSAGIG